MRKLWLLLALSAATANMQAQSFYVCRNGVATTASELSFNGGQVNGQPAGSIDSITTHVPQLRFVGGDISMLTKYEEKGATYMDNAGNKVEPLPFLARQGMNAMRVRLFVDPSKASSTHQREGVVQDLDYVAALGRRIKAAGLLFMLDFHYSDTWTDPGQHSTPSAWNTMTPAQLEQQIYDYTRQCLSRLCNEGAAPDFIQPGNEITYGMLWPTGHVWPGGGGQDGGTWNQFAAYLRQAVKACREVCPRAQIVIQTEMSKASNVTSFYKTMEPYAIDYDVIGLSYYPDFHGTLATLNSTLSTLEAQQPGKKIMIVETGYGYAWPIGTTYNLSSTYPLTEEGQRKFTADLITTLRRHPQVNGLFWWWPEANEYGINWQNAVTTSWWNASLFDNRTGRALKALDELKSFTNP